MRKVVALALLLAACSRNGQAASADVVLTARPTTVDFGPVLVGQERLIDVAIDNTGTGPATLLASLSSGPFRIVTGASLQLAPGTSGSVRVGFSPEDQRSYSATLHVAGSGASLTVALLGSGARIAVDAPMAIDFGDVRLGEMASLPVRLRNPGLLPLTVQPSLGGDDPSFFRVEEQFLILGAGDEGVFHLDFVPGQPGDVSAQLALQSCFDCGAATVTLSGRGVDPRLSAIPLAVDVGGALVGEHISAPLAIWTVDGVPDRIDSVTIVGDDTCTDMDGAAVSCFSVEPAGLPRVIGPDPLNLTVTFAPLAAGPHQATIVVAHQGEPFEIPVTGSAMLWTLRADPNVLSFGILPTGSSRTMELVLRNPGSAIVPVQSALVSGPFDAQLPDLPFTPFEPVVVPVRFDATGVGTFSGRLTLDAGQVGQVRLAVPLTAVVVPSPPCHFDVAPTSLRFGQWPVGKSIEREVVLTNNSGTACLVGDFQVSGDVGFSLAGSATMQTVPPGGKVHVLVAYHPVKVGLRLDRSILRFDQPDPDQPTIEIPLSGIGGSGLTADGIDVGRVPVGRVGLASVTLQNDDRFTARISKIELAPGMSRDFLVTSPPQDVAPKANGSIPVQFRPSTLAPPASSGQLFIWLEGAIEPLIVDISGTGVSDGCVGDCDAPVVTCPVDFSAAAYDWVHLSGAAIDPQGSVVSCHFVVVAYPTPAEATTIGCGADLSLDAPGVYDVRLDASDSAGNVGSCHTRITASDSDDLVVRSWPSGGPDLNLRLFHPLAGDPTQASTWRSNSYVCGADNQSPTWDAKNDAANPVFHDGRRGMPDVVMMKKPAAGGRYTVGVRWGSGRGGSLQAHTEIFCGGPATTLDSLLTRIYGATLVTDITYDAMGTCHYADRSETLIVQ